MFKKINTTKLLIIFGILLVFVVLLQVIQRRGGERNFKSDILTVDTAKITVINVSPRDGKELRITRNGRDWSFTEKGKTKVYRADKNVIKGLLSYIAMIKADHVSGTDKSDWVKLGVTDTFATGSRVILEQGNKVVADFLMGKFTFEYPQNFTTYVRLYNEVETYAIKGLMPRSFSVSPEYIRDRNLVDLKMSDITKLSFNYPDSSFTVSKEKNQWKINGEKADSAQVANYVGNICKLTGQEFLNDTVKSGSQVFSVKIDANNSVPVELKANAIAGMPLRYAISSNINPDTWFDGSKGNLTHTIFAGAKQFKNKPKEIKAPAKKK